jgi:hypothetical protein
MEPPTRTARCSGWRDPATGRVGAWPHEAPVGAFGGNIAKARGINSRCRICARDYSRARRSAQLADDPEGWRRRQREQKRAERAARWQTDPPPPHPLQATTDHGHGLEPPKGRALADRLRAKRAAERAAGG